MAAESESPFWVLKKAIPGTLKKGQDAVSEKESGGIRAIALADGVTSAGDFAGFGAMAAAKAATDFFLENFDDIVALEEDKLRNCAYSLFRNYYLKVLNKYAAMRGFPTVLSEDNKLVYGNITKYSTTVVSCAVKGDKLLILKIGNGVVAADAGFGFGVVSPSVTIDGLTQSIERIVDPGFADFSFKRYRVPNLLCVALMSDGVECAVPRLYDPHIQKLTQSFQIWIGNATVSEKEFSLCVDELGKTGEDDISIAMILRRDESFQDRPILSNNPFECMELYTMPIPEILKEPEPMYPDPDPPLVEQDIVPIENAKSEGWRKRKRKRIGSYLIVCVLCVASGIVIALIPPWESIAGISRDKNRQTFQKALDAFLAGDDAEALTELNKVFYANDPELQVMAEQLQERIVGYYRSGTRAPDRVDGLTDAQVLNSETYSAEQNTEESSAVEGTDLPPPTMGAEHTQETIEEQIPSSPRTEPPHGAEPFLTVVFGNMEWLVLSSENGESLLLSKYVIGFGPFQATPGVSTWENSTIRNYLNTEFLKIFSESERARISEKTVKTQDTAISAIDGTYTVIAGGNQTIDKVFLLSIEEIDKHFSEDNAEGRKDWWTERYGDDMATTPYPISQISVVGAQTELKGRPVWWWLRSPSYYEDGTAVVMADGGLSIEGYASSSKDGGIRPAMWITPASGGKR
ncbi:MAG: DUF6273 domain-containing protein [Clostridiales bacterium]|jgi:hypothetical protein|nr:DUF6273 domain-containing protein [Clostridiales bacterium]MDR2751239.1 DUF6273 domain-containing protein [Clostridiales bacterium]